MGVHVATAARANATYLIQNEQTNVLIKYSAPLCVHVFPGPVFLTTCFGACSFTLVLHIASMFSEHITCRIQWVTGLSEFS